MTTIFGIVYEHVPNEGTVRSPLYIVPLHVVDVVKDPTNRTPGLCFMQVICTANVPVPALGISMGQKLTFGRTVPVATELGALLPHTTAPYHGFQDAETGRLVGGGEFYETFAEVNGAAKGRNYISLVPAS